jgi:hypothetical protein
MNDQPPLACYYIYNNLVFSLFFFVKEGTPGVQQCFRCALKPVKFTLAGCEMQFLLDGFSTYSTPGPTFTLSYRLAV